MIRWAVLMLAVATVSALGVACSSAAREDVLGDDCVEGEEISSDSGLMQVDLDCGDGAEASHGDALVVSYTGTLENGTEFDSAESYEFLLESDKVIGGWNEGLDGMQVGGTRRLVIPPDLAYGKDGVAGLIPQNATLTYHVTLMEVHQPE